MDGTIGRVRSALGMASRSPRRVVSRGKEEHPRGFEEELERRGDEPDSPSSHETVTEPETERPAPGPDLGSHLDVVA